MTEHNNVTVSRELLRKVLNTLIWSIQMTEMTALELADYMESKYDLFPRSEQMQAADMLRRQHEAIKVLRECLIDCLDDSRQVTEEYAAAYGNYRPERLAAMRKTVTDAPAVEPVAWMTFDGEGGYELRLYEMNESYRDEYIKRNGEKYASWVQPLFTAPKAQQSVQEPDVDYRSMYLKVRDDLAAAQQRLDTCEALARSVMNDQVGRA